MSTGGRGPDSRWPSPWKVPPARGRVPTPASEVVTARPLLDALHAALDGPAPCTAAPAIWTSDAPDDVLVAQEGCADCPARQACGAYADAIEASAGGTWGGVDRTPRDARRTTTTTTTTEMEQAS